MRRVLLPLLIAGALAVGGIIAWTLLSHLGHRSADEEVATVTQDLAPFSRIEIDGSAEVTLVQGAREAIAYASDPGTPVRAGVSGDTLHIAAIDRRRWWDNLFGGRNARGAPRITITFNKLEALALAGAVSVRAERVETPQLRVAASGGTKLRIEDLHATSLRVAGSGALDATITGEVTDAAFSISGAGQVRADTLKATNASVSVSGVGKAVVRVEKSLRASISGAGTIEYYGNPEVKESVSGMGRVKRREAGMHERFEVASAALPKIA
jgi:hypothetical protein